MGSYGFQGKRRGISRRQHSTEGGGYVKLTANEGGIIGILQSLGSSDNFVVTKPTSLNTMATVGFSI